MDYLPNKLNEYETYTYNLSLHMVHPAHAGSLDDAIRAGLAEEFMNNASDARYNISNVEQIFVTGAGQVRSTFGNRFDMTVDEPNGCTLLSHLTVMSARLNITSHLQAMYILKIEFNGRKENGIPVKFPTVFYYAVKIRNLQFNVKDGGTTYTLELYEHSTAAYSYLNNVIKDQITVEAQTVGEFISRFQEKLNIAALNIWKTNTSALYQDTYELSLDDASGAAAWGAWRFQALDETYEGNAENVIGADGNAALQITVNNGSSLTDIIGTVLQLTKEYKQVPNDVNGYFREKPSLDTGESKLDNFPVFYKVLGDIKYNKYDILKGEYEKKIIYKVIRHIVTNEIVDPVAYVKSITDTTVQNNRVANMKSSDLLRKRYDYLYTGRNTEVLELDLKFDLAYYYITPHGGGLLGDPAIQTPINLNDSISMITRLGNLKKAIVAASASVNAGPRAVVSADGLGISDLNVSNPASAAALEQALISSFQDDITKLLDKFKHDYELNPHEINYQIKFASDVLDAADTEGSDNDREGGTFNFGATKANMENAADMIVIELGIRGDPYWMGRPNTLANNFSKSENKFDDLADYEKGSLNFFLKVNLPVPHDDAHGRRKPQTDYQITGLYRVISVINQFRNGQFIQYLKAVRDLGTNSSTAASALDSDNVVDNTAARWTRNDPGADIAQVIEDARNRDPR